MWWTEITYSLLFYRYVLRSELIMSTDLFRANWGILLYMKTKQMSFHVFHFPITKQSSAYSWHSNKSTFILVNSTYKNQKVKESSESCHQICSISLFVWWDSSWLKVGLSGTTLLARCRCFIVKPTSFGLWPSFRVIIQCITKNILYIPIVARVLTSSGHEALALHKVASKAISQEVVCIRISGVNSKLYPAHIFLFTWKYITSLYCFTVYSLLKGLLFTICT